MAFDDTFNGDWRQQQPQTMPFFRPDAKLDPSQIVDMRAKILMDAFFRALLSAHAGNIQGGHYAP